MDTTLPKPDTTACCPDAYWCPTAGETECPRHGGFTTCCAHIDQHQPMNIEAWHHAQEMLERALLNNLFRAARDARQEVGRSRMLGPVLDVVLGVVTPSTLGPVHDVIHGPAR